MFSSTDRRPARNTSDADVARAREQFKPQTVAAGGRSAAPPEATAWFDGDITRRVMAPGLDGPQSDTYLPPPLKAKSAAHVKAKLKRRRVFA
jgi:hypothetical protein